MDQRRGYFTFRGVTPGTYSLTALATTGGEREVASAVIQVAHESVENVQLIFGVPNVIAGSLRIEEKEDLGSLKGGRLNFVPIGGGIMLVSPVAVLKSDGSFQVKNLIPDRYRVVFQPELQSYYVKSVRVGPVASTEPIMDVTDSIPSEVTVTLSSRAAQINGVVNEENKPAVGAVVGLVPVDRDKTYLYKAARADWDGKFKINAIPPGQYKLFAFEAAELDSWQDPEFLKRHEESGISVVLTEAAHETKYLTLLRVPK